MSINISCRHIFVAVEVSSGSILFAHSQYSCVKNFYDSLLRSLQQGVHYAEVKKQFRLVKYDLNPRYFDELEPSFGYCLVEELKKTFVGKQQTNKQTERTK